MTEIKRERPPMPPLVIRVKVAERQFDAAFARGRDVYDLLRKDWSLGRRLQWLLFRLFCDDEKGGVRPHALDHDPALILRPYNPRKKDVAARYTPHAHDPAALIYRLKEDHQQKTTGRKPGAERTVTTKGSDIGLKAKFARLERRKVDTSDIPETPKSWFKRAKMVKRKANIPSRPFRRKTRKPPVDNNTG